VIGAFVQESLFAGQVFRGCGGKPSVGPTRQRRETARAQKLWIRSSDALYEWTQRKKRQAERDHRDRDSRRDSRRELDIHPLYPSRGRDAEKAAPTQDPAQPISLEYLITDINQKVMEKEPC